MPFCESCGAPVSGAFCTQCGGRSKAGEPAPASPTSPAPAVAAPRKTSPLVWILVAILGLFVVGGIAVVGTGIFFVHKAKQAGLDPAVMRTDPALANAVKLGAKACTPVISIGEIGRIAVIQDPQGATIGLHEPPK